MIWFLCFLLFSVVKSSKFLSLYFDSSNRLLDSSISELFDSLTSELFDSSKDISSGFFSDYHIIILLFLNVSLWLSN